MTDRKSDRNGAGAKMDRLPEHGCEQRTPALHRVLEFFSGAYPLNGTPAQGDPSKAPDISTNSWGCAVV